MARKNQGSNKSWGDLAFVDAFSVPSSGFDSRHRHIVGDLQGPARVITHANRFLGTLSIALHPPYGIGDSTNSIWGVIGWGFSLQSEGSPGADVAFGPTDDDSDEPWLWREWHTICMHRNNGEIPTVAIVTPLRMDGAMNNVFTVGANSSDQSNVLSTRFDVPFRGGRGTNMNADIDIVFSITFRSWAGQLVSEAGLDPQFSTYQGSGWQVIYTCYGSMLFTQA